MRIAAVALVLILGAAVVLWFGNTLNSWVLGGLIGGLAALLLSIPISLTLFSFLSRRHDERLEAEAQEQLALDMSYEEYPAEAFAPIEDDDVYMLPQPQVEEYEEYEDQRRMQRVSPARNLPAPPSYARLPAPGQSHAPANNVYQQRAVNNNPPRPISPPARANGTAAQSPSPERRVNRPAFPAPQPNSYHQHYTSALRTAQREAALQQQNEQYISSSPTMPSKKLPAVRPNLSLIEQPGRPKEQRQARQASQQTPGQQRRARRVVDAEPAGAEPRGYSQRSPATDSTTPQTTQHTESLRSQEPHTDYLFGQYPGTAPVRSQPQTGQTTRNPHLGEQLGNPETMTGSLKNPMVRRAPYLYDDDPLKQELAQQIDGPITRRSSRFEDQES